MPCVHQITYGPESAGDDAALIQRKASFDTRRADRASVSTVRPAPRIRSSTAERHVHTVEVGGSTSRMHGAQIARLVDGAGWRGRWSWPTRREFDSPHSPWV